MKRVKKSNDFDIDARTHEQTHTTHLFSRNIKRYAQMNSRI